jgi:hypothetical protein
MAKSAEVLLRGVDADIARLEGELADLRDFRARLSRYAMRNGTHRNGTPAIVPKRAYHRKHHNKGAAETSSRPRARNGKPGIGATVLNWVRTHPGLPRKQVIQELAGMNLTDKRNPKKVFQTRVGQLLDTNELRKEGEGDRLFVNE